MKKEVEVVFSGYRSAPRFFVNGVWGGPLTENHLVAHFLFKHVTPPETMMVDVKTGEQISQDGVIDMNEVLCTLVIPPGEALSIGKWLIRHAEAMIENKDSEQMPEGATIQ